MRSMQIVDWGKPLEYHESSTPEPQGTEVLVRITSCGVCHSDIHIWDGYFDLGHDAKIEVGKRGVTLPFTMGHEPLGTVEALGPEADGVEVGDSRIVFPWIGCGQCGVCRNGQELLCLTPRIIGTRVHGGYSDYVVVPHAKYLVDYTGVPEALACTYACSGLTAYSALRKIGDLGPDDWLVLIGGGGVGMSALHAASAVTPAKVIMADVDGTKRSAARQAGAVETVDNSESDAIKKVMDITGGGAAAAIDFVGIPDTVKFGMRSLRKGATQVQVGLFGGAVEISPVMLPFMMMDLRGSYVGTLQEMHELMDLVKAGKVAPLPIETRPLEQVNDVLDDLKAGRILGRVVLKP